MRESTTVRKDQDSAILNVNEPRQTELKKFI